MGLSVGFAEGATDILFGTIVDSRWVRGNFQFAATTKLLYIAFNSALYMVLFQLLGVISAAIRIKGTKSGILSALPRSEALPYWILAFIALGAAVFSNTNETLWSEVELSPILGIVAVHIVFIALVVLQVRSFIRKTDRTGSDDFAVVRPKHEARAAAYIFLAVASLFVPDFSESPTSPLARCVLLFSVLIFVYPLSSLIEKVLSAYYGRTAGRSGLGKLAALPAVAAVVIPLCTVAVLARQPTDVKVFSSFSGAGQKGSAPDGKKSPNVIIMLIDMLRADHVGCYGYHRETTPNIDRYAREGVLFTNARAQSAWTLPSTTTLLSGLFPSTHGATTVFSSLSDEAETMAEVFNRNGYATAALVANPVIARSYNVNQGFEYYCDDIMSYTYLLLAMNNASLLSKSINAMETTKLLFSNEQLNVFRTPDIAGYTLLFRPDEVGIEKINAGALKWIRKNPGRPFLLYLHYLDIHGPFRSPRLFEEKDFKGRTERRINAYDGAIRYTDAQIGLFLEELDRLGVLDDSIVMITSDHGEEFGDHGGRTHGYNLYEEQLRVPLVYLRTPAFPYNKTVSEPVGLVDVMPTLIAHLELESPDRLSHGASFSDLFHSDARRNAPEYQYAETRLGIPFKSVTYQNRWKFIYSQQEDSRGEWLFDLSQDEFEKVNLLKDRPIIASKLREKLDETFAGYKNDALASETFEPDEKTRQMLHSLGYIQ